jgi:GDPmannose 4,6-dehydratase
MTKIAIVTGANSMDAKSLARFLQYKDYHVVLTFRRNSLFNRDDWYREVQIDAANVGRFSFEVCDITDQNSVRECLTAVLAKHGAVHELYMIAAMSHVGYSFTQKEYSIAANGQSYYFFLEALRLLSPTTRVYGALTSELAGNVPDGSVFNEDTLWHPKSPYSIGKALGGHWIQFYRESRDAGMFACFGILFNHSNWFRTNDFYVMKCAQAAAEIVEGKRMSLALGNLSFYRDEHWSDYGVEMMWAMLQRDTPQDYVVGTGVCHHGEEYLDHAFGHFNLDWHKHVVIDETLKRPNEVHRLVADSTRAQRDLGWNPRRLSFQNHMRHLCEYAYVKARGQVPVLPNMYTLYP